MLSASIKQNKTKIVLDINDSKVYGGVWWRAGAHFAIEDTNGRD